MSRRPKRSDEIGDFRSANVLNYFEIVVRLKIGPELGRCSKIARETECGVGGDGPLAANDVVDAVAGLITPSPAYWPYAQAVLEGLPAMFHPHGPET